MRNKYFSTTDAINVSFNFVASTILAYVYQTPLDRVRYFVPLVCCWHRQLHIIKTQDAPMDSSPLFLGLDLSTQGIKATAVSEGLEIVFTTSISFDNDLSEFETKGGFHRDKANHNHATAPTLMWVKGLDVLFSKMKEDDFPFRNVRVLFTAF